MEIQTKKVAHFYSSVSLFLLFFCHFNYPFRGEKKEQERDPFTDLRRLFQT